MTEVKELSQLEVIKQKKSEMTENSRLEALKKKREQLNARIQVMEASEKSKLRKKETRKKIIVGAYIIDQAAKDGTLDKLYNQVKKYCVRDTDKILFE